ncbi:hypothetical protein [Bradyrhizobium canariense]|uniref:hypothetical protein n=1 Tax=Bradyrhizobium canariense TaxID=255045 RepID=UPI00201377EA|nr:hypothetical protein [Bradyrhizobium canariense]
MELYPDLPCNVCDTRRFHPDEGFVIARFIQRSCRACENALHNGNHTGTFDMGKVVFLYRSLAYRNAAADILSKARKLPRGAERSAARRYAKALRDLAQTEAWLEGRVAREPRTAQRMKSAASA